MASATSSQQYPSTPMASPATITTANPNRDGSGTTAVLASAVTTAQRIDWVHFAALGTVTDGMLRVFLKTNAGTSTLLVEIPVPATTPSGSVKAWAADWYPSVPAYQQPSPLVLQMGQSLTVSTENGELFAVTAFGWNY